MRLRYIASASFSYGFSHSTCPISPLGRRTSRPTSPMGSSGIHSTSDSFTEMQQQLSCRALRPRSSISSDVIVCVGSIALSSAYLRTLPVLGPLNPYMNLMLPRPVISLRQPMISRTTTIGRSEEHTSELQSHVKLVCRLLLEKKKKKLNYKKA